MNVLQNSLWPWAPRTSVALSRHLEMYPQLSCPSTVCKGNVFSLSYHLHLQENEWKRLQTARQTRAIWLWLMRAYRAGQPTFSLTIFCSWNIWSPSLWRPLGNCPSCPFLNPGLSIHHACSTATDTAGTSPMFTTELISCGVNSLLLTCREPATHNHTRNSVTYLFIKI